MTSSWSFIRQISFEKILCKSYENIRYFTRTVTYMLLLPATYIPCKVIFVQHSILCTLYFIHLPMKMEPIVSSETSAIRTQTPGNYPKRNKLHLEHDESLKTNSILSYCCQGHVAQQYAQNTLLHFHSNNGLANMTTMLVYTTM